MFLTGFWGKFLFIYLLVILHTFAVITHNLHQGTSWYLTQDTGGGTQQTSEGTILVVGPLREIVF